MLWGQVGGHYGFRPCALLVSRESWHAMDHLEKIHQEGGSMGEQQGVAGSGFIEGRW
jgi:hypothetical protein